MNKKIYDRIIDIAFITVLIVVKKIVNHQMKISNYYKKEIIRDKTLIVSFL